MRKITVGASVDVGIICFPLHERDNWKWGRSPGMRCLCLGPMRVWMNFKRETAQR